MKIVWRSEVLTDQGTMRVIESASLSDLKKQTKRDRLLGYRLWIVWPPSLKKQLSFLQEVSQLLDLGIPLTEAIAQAPTHFPVLIRSLEQGYALEHALSAAHFPVFMAPLIVASQNSGDVVKAFQFLYNFLIERQKIGTQLRKTLLGSGLTLIIGCVTVGILLTVLVPQLLPLLPEGEQGMGLKTLLWISQGREGGLILLGFGLLIGSVGVRFLVRFKKELAQASACRLLGSLLSHGLSLTQALQILIPTTPFLESVRIDLERGKPVSDSVGLFLKDKHARALLSLGAQSQRMAESFGLCAEMIETRVTDTLTRLTHAIAPTISLSVGGLLIWVVMSVIAPLYEKILGVV